jgi:hypothetical protein
MGKGTKRREERPKKDRKACKTFKHTRIKIKIVSNLINRARFREKN